MTSTLPTKSRNGALLVLAVFALGGCGESAQDKAKAQVCSARADISKQINSLSGLTPTTSSVTAAKASFEAIGADLTKIKNAQGNLDSGRKAQVETATRTFESQVRSIASSLGSSLTLGNAGAQFNAALSQLTTAYKQALAPINCA